MKWWNRKLVSSAVVVLVLSLGWGNLSALASCGGTAGDPSFCSSNYMVVESQIGGVPDNSSSSTSYSFTPGTDDGGSTVGDLAVGNSSSTNYQTNSGYNTTYNPDLTFIVSATPVSLGNLTTTSTGTGTATFSVRNYTSYGYVVQVIGSPPTNAGHPLAAMGTQSANSTACSPSCTSSQGAEQFGMDLVANTSPATFGSNLVQVPSSSFSYGSVAAGYGTTNSYRYFSGDTIASAAKSSGETDYTISFLANISALTPGGAYSGTLSLVATGTY